MKPTHNSGKPAYQSAVHTIRQWLADNPRHPDIDARKAELLRLERTAGLRTVIAREGQPVVDEPRYSTTHALPVAHGIASAFGREIPQAVQVFEGYDSTRLRWMKPDGKGGLEPVSK